ncbi:MAG TPA: general secretion pathway protein [Gammaproteobacteria bacterium]|nr:general secretion pathway protein [Porticoccaceae bacterium]HBA33164.1 general secretion pathway protein [Gammaproteobacteria bacterium]HCO59926.1 general secretion pathway protein [Porticoccaceae bacterium]
MYQKFYGLAEAPFSPYPDVDFWYQSGRYQSALDGVRLSLAEQAGLVVMTGPAGIGKSTVAGQFLSSLSSGVTAGYLSNTIYRDVEELLKWILLSFDCDYRTGDRVSLFHIFADFLIKQHQEGQKVVLMLDEAHTLSHRAFNQLKMLTNINANKRQLLRLVLIGQPKLIELLKDARNSFFTQCVTVERQLFPLNSTETVEYIHYRIRKAGGDPFFFPEDACEMVWQHASGLPRVINALCDASLLKAHAEHIEVVDPKTVEGAASELSVSIHAAEHICEALKAAQSS